MTDAGEFKALVRQRMAVTGEKYTVAYRALLDAAAGAVAPPRHRILPRIAAKYTDKPAKPVYVRLRLWEVVDLSPGETEIAEYLATDETGRLDLIRHWLSDQIDQLIFDDALIREHEVVSEDEVADEHARREAGYLGILPDQYLWLEERLTDEEFSALSDEGMHQLLAAEYIEYPVSRGAGRKR